MIVSHKYKFVYLAPPKTANRSLHNYLGQPAFVQPGTENRKGTMHVFEVPEEVRHYFTFASIRHPLDRTASLWAHSQTDISRKMQKTVTMGFEEFVLDFQFKEGTLWFFTKSQAELLQDVRLDGVVRFDHLEEDLASLPPIARALKTETSINPLPHIGKNEHPPWQDLFSPRMRRMVLQHWGADLDLYARGATTMDSSMKEDDLRRETIDLALCAELHGAATLPSGFHNQGLVRQAEMAAWIVLRLLRSAERGDKPALRFWRHRNRPPHLPRPCRSSRKGHKPCIALLTPSLQMGGAERWVLDLARHLDRARVEVCGIGSYGEAHDKLFWDRAMRETTVAVGRPACNELVQGADAVICWGIRELPLNSPEVSIYVSHGSGIFPRLAREMAVNRRCHLAAVSRAAAKPFPDVAKVTIIHNGVDVARCREREGRAATRRKWKLAPAEKAIGYVGRITQQKNASAAALAAATGRGLYRAVYVGTGTKEFLDVVRSFPGAPVIQDRVEEIGDVYRALDCFVLVSPSEGFSLSLAEAWYCGCPTVATPVGAVPELEEQFGQLTCRVPVDPSGHQLAEAVRRAMSPENRPIVERAQAVVREHFTVERMARRWTDFVLELLKKNAGTAGRQEAWLCHS